MTPSPALAAFLSLIAWSEGTSISPATKNNGYDVIVSGPAGPEIFTEYAYHPFENRVPKLVNGALHSTAAGRYQLLVRFWRAYRDLLELKDFSPASQDAVALRQMHERGAVTRILAGDIQGAIEACSNIWASFPGNGYGQSGGHTMGTLLTVYNRLQMTGKALP
jgi:muramidase (phage lysozyme)